jgi:hypothetical protein
MTIRRAFVATAALAASSLTVFEQALRAVPSGVPITND